MFVLNELALTATTNEWKIGVPKGDQMGKTSADIDDVLDKSVTDRKIKRILEDVGWTLKKSSSRVPVELTI